MKPNSLICKILQKSGGIFLDENNIGWKYINGELIGKRTVYTHDLRAVWIEDVKKEEIRSWWCGKDSDYTECFK